MRDGRIPARLHWALAAGGGTAVLVSALAPLADAAPQLADPSPVVQACAKVGADASSSQLATIVLTTLALMAVVRGAAAVAAVAHATREARRLRGSPAVLHGHPVTIVPSARAAAFTAGWLRPRTFLSEGALHKLDTAQLVAVLEHEHHHRRRRDPLRLAARRVLSETLFFFPSLRRLRRGHDELAEIDADAAAARAAGGDVRPLAGALLAFDRAAPAGAGVSPARVDRLLGSGRRTGGPTCARDLLATAAAAVVLAALALVATADASDHVFRLCAGTLAAVATASSAAWRAHTGA